MSQAPVLRVPLRRFYGQSMQIPIHNLLLQIPARNAQLDSEGWSGRRVLGYKLPPWQRREKWNDDQCRRFIESIYLGGNIGSFMVNSVFEPVDLDKVLLDGQQRFRALERYWSNEFPIAGEDGRDWYWQDLTQHEKAHMLRIGFPWIETSYRDEAVLIEAYNRHNYGGTPHEPDEFAPGSGDLRDAEPFMKPF